MKKLDQLEKIIKNHEERIWMEKPYNPKADYVKEAVQMYHEMWYLINVIEIAEEISYEQIRQAARKSKAKRETSRKRSLYKK